MEIELETRIKTNINIKIIIKMELPAQSEMKYPGSPSDLPQHRIEPPQNHYDPHQIQINSPEFKWS